jgi:hypothetical protein
MKKLFAMMLIAGVFAACNGGSKSGNTDSTTTSSSDTSSVNKDTSTMKTDSMVNNAPDTVKAK